MVEFHSNLGRLLKEGTAAEVHGSIINDQVGTSYTLAASDAEPGYLRCTNASPITVTVPMNAVVPIPVGRTVPGIQGGDGQITFAGTPTINSAETLKTRKKFSAFALIKVDTDEWDLVGDLEIA